MALYFRTLFFSVLMIVVIILAAGCSERTLDLEMSETEIAVQSGEQLLHIDDIPENISVDSDTEFGASARFTDAKSSAAGRWIAVTTVGVAHGAGWIFDVETGEIIPAAFQYGGSVSIGPWSDDSRYVVFIEEGPAPMHSLSIVDTESPGSTVGDTAHPIRVDAHSDAVPPETTYTPIEWDGNRLIFTVNGSRYSYHTTTGEVNPEETEPS